jgi:MFS transporter, YNFM family, putative membrane transport protein
LTAGKIERRRLAAVVLAGFCAFLDLYSAQPLLPLLMDLFQESTSRVTLLVSVSTGAVALTAPLVGLLADRFGRRRLIVPSALLLAVPTFLAATSRSFGQLLFWRFWQGVFTPGVFAATVAYISEEWTVGRGAAMSAYVAGTAVGGFAGRSVSALITEHFSWQAAYVVLGILNLIGGLAIWAWLPADTPKNRVKTKGGSFLHHLRNPLLVATYTVGFCVLFTLASGFTYVNFYLAGPPFQWSTGALGLVFSAYLFAAAITSAGGRIIDRIGHRKAVVGALAFSIAGTLLTLVPSGAIVFIGLIMCCSGVFLSQSAANSFIGVATPHNRASAVGLYVTFYYVGGSFGATAPASLWNIGGWPACVALIVFVQLFTMWVAGRFWSDQRITSAQSQSPQA